MPPVVRRKAIVVRVGEHGAVVAGVAGQLHGAGPVAGTPCVSIPGSAWLKNAADPPYGAFCPHEGCTSPATVVPAWFSNPPGEDESP